MNIFLRFLAIFTVLIVPFAASAKEPKLLDNVITKGEIRCGYVLWPPMTIRDLKTGKITGVFSEVIEKVAQNAGLKIVWTEEASYGSAIEGLKTKRYDMICSSIWPNATRAMNASFTTPLNYSVIEAYVRPDENRIKSLEDINNTNITISTIDGEAGQSIAREDFPNAKTSNLPQMTDYGQLYTEVLSRKSDVVLHDLVAVNDFLKKNPGSLKRLAPGKPLRISANSFMLPKGEDEFREFLNLAIQDLINSGYVAKVIKKYDLQDGMYPVALPYQAQ